MKKRKNQPLVDEAIRNPVAKFAHQFNKAQVFEDKRKYRRNGKHRKQEAMLIIFNKVISVVSCFINVKQSGNLSNLGQSRMLGVLTSG